MWWGSYVVNVSNAAYGSLRAMTEKELKRLSRRDLLEILLALRRENDQLRLQLTQANQRLESRRLEIEASGSIAEAALRLSGIFEVAQAACDRYADHVRRRMRLEEQQTNEKCQAMLAQAKIQADAQKHLTDVVDASQKQDGAQ